MRLSGILYRTRASPRQRCHLGFCFRVSGWSTSDHPLHRWAWRAGDARIMPVPQLHATIETKRRRPDAQAVLSAIMAELSEHGVTPTPMAIISAATDNGADEALTA